MGALSPKTGITDSEPRSHKKMLVEVENMSSLGNKPLTVMEKIN